MAAKLIGMVRQSAKIGSNIVRALQCDCTEANDMTMSDINPPRIRAMKQKILPPQLRSMISSQYTNMNMQYPSPVANPVYLASSPLSSLDGVRIFSKTAARPSIKSKTDPSFFRYRSNVASKLQRRIMMVGLTKNAHETRLPVSALKACCFQLTSLGFGIGAACTGWQEARNMPQAGTTYGTLHMLIAFVSGLLPLNCPSVSRVA